MRSLATLLLPSLAALSACSAAKITIDTTDTASGTPQLEVNPTLVDFGAVSAGMGGTAAVIELTNSGDAELQIQGFAVDDPTGPFSVTSTGDSVLAPGETTSAILAFDPDAPGSYASNLSIASTDPDGLQQIVLVGDAADGGLALDPASADFGTLTVGCGATLDVAVQNLGGSAVTVSSLALDGGEEEMTVEADTPLPWTIAPGASSTLTISYEPMLAHVVFGTLTVNTSSTVTPVLTGTYFGEGQQQGTATDHYTTPDGVVDVVVFVDKSQSMQTAGYVNTFRSSMISLYDTLEAADADFQIAILTDDDGCVNGRDNFITKDMSRNQALGTMSLMLDTTYYGGELAESGFSVLYAGLREEATGEHGCNAGLLRSNGALALIGVSDEDEQSGGDESAWVAEFTGLKSDPTRVHLSAIVGDLPAGCEDAKAATVWSDVAQLTGGATSSICSTDWTGVLSEMAAASSGLATTYALSSEPDVGSIVVTIDGEVSNDWTWDEGTRSITFTSGAQLTWNQSIDVTYDIAQTCSG